MGIECTGFPAAFPKGIELTRRMGRFVEADHYTDPGNIEINPHTMGMKDIDTLGSWAYPPTKFDTALQLLKRGIDSLPLADIITHRFSVAKAERSIETVRSLKGIKMVITHQKKRN